MSGLSPSARVIRPAVSPNIPSATTEEGGGAKTFSHMIQASRALSVLISKQARYACAMMLECQQPKIN